MEAGAENYHQTEDVTVDDKDLRIIDWRLGHHIEAAAKIIGGAIMALARSVDAQNARWDRIAGAMERENVLREQEIQIRREHVSYVLEQRDMAARAAERIMGLGFYGRPKAKDGEEQPSPIPPEWLEEVLGNARDCRCEETDGKGCPIPAHQPVEEP